MVGAVSTYAPPDGFARNVAVLALLLVVVNLPSTSVWAAFGTILRPLLADPAAPVHLVTVRGLGYKLEA